jgi:hypothetical protein
MVFALLLGVVTAGTVALLAAPASAARSSAAAVAPADLPAVHQVTLTRTGGFFPRHEVLVVEATDTRREVAYLMALAASPEFRALKPSYLPSNPCCDRITSEVTVTYADGTTQTVVTMDGVEVPAVLTKVIQLTGRLGAFATADQ